MKLIRQFVLLFVCAISSFTLAADPSVGELLNNGRIDEAIRALNAQVASNPQNAAAHAQLCRAYFQLEDFDNAIRSCEKSTQFAPQNASYHLWLGRAYGEKADRVGPFSAMSLAKKTVSEFERAVQLDPKDMAARFDLIEYYLQAPGIVGGGRDKAERLAAQTASVDPAAGAYMRAQIAMKDKNFDEAARQIKTAIQASKNSAQYWVELARVYKAARRWPDFEGAIVNAQNSSNKRPEDTFNAADMLLGAGRNLPGAAQMLRNYLAGPKDETAPAFRAQYLLGQVLEKMGDRNGAINAYKASLSLASSFRPAKDALNRLGA